MDMVPGICLCHHEYLADIARLRRRNACENNPELFGEMFSSSDYTPQAYISKYILAYIHFAEINKPVYNVCVMLTWDDSYAIALALREQRPDVNLEMISLGMIYHWALELDGFQDDPELANDGVSNGNLPGMV